MQLPSMRVDGKIALVTGAGSGLGQAIAIGLAQAGADVALTELPGREMAAEDTVQAIEAAARRAGVWPLDVTRLGQHHRARGLARLDAADVKRVATKYFTQENRTVAIYTRKPAGKSEIRNPKPEGNPKSE